MKRPRAFARAGLDARLSSILQGALVAAAPPAEGRRQLLRAASRLEHELAHEREVLYHRAQVRISLWYGAGTPRLGWMTLPLSQNFLLGFPKPRFSW